jgi:ABC-type amino acid transport system permease subunit
MTTVQVLRRVILPQTFTRMLPPIANMLVSLLKDTSLVSVIGIAELMYQARNINSLTFRPLEILTGVAFIYFFLTYPIALLAEHLHRSIERR